ncbi:uncharacterized protein [Anabrus simplex]|uniref:uncharacterized protein isoform X2 n=1 Tax=Anabrus simplex TaxID=316456 RepID=UPI0035A2FC1C
MDQIVQIKEEPLCLEGTTSTSLENFEFISDMIPLKQETKSELTEPGPTQENAFEVVYILCLLEPLKRKYSWNKGWLIYQFHTSKKKTMWRILQYCQCPLQRGRTNVRNAAVRLLNEKFSRATW